MGFYESVDKETQRDADEMIEELLEEGGRREPGFNNNYDLDGYFEKAYESVKHLIDSEESKEIMMRAYD